MRNTHSFILISEKFEKVDTKKLKSLAASNQNEWTSSKDKVALILASKQTNFLGYQFLLFKKKT